ncbi:hypothetical protein [Gordonia sp. 852002-51296_SCH5728562-b]|uniref:hypothetical protein n=1 Tax=Gordonia sp. 852002-51296_SCH5728562-b TaxID=1834101 RepID=UPI0007EBE974|nr:hypothetical protein [Gordonia sp. 852002-51296_SCH5728562-b]OBA44021.1 hypothetical protein A5766_00295 [Gordonia sp. 852002-51296_SCH5728562-b]
MSGLTVILRRITTAATEDEKDRIVAEAEQDLPLLLDLATLVDVDHRRIIVAHVIGTVMATTASHPTAVHLERCFRCGRAAIYDAQETCRRCRSETLDRLIDAEARALELEAREQGEQA